MFTGIVSAKKRITSTTESLGIKKVGIQKDTSEQLTKGESIAINGVCSTIVEITNEDFFVEYMSETLKKTTLSRLTSGESVNFEKSLKVGEPLSGHFVYGHIDNMGSIEKIELKGDSKEFYIALPEQMQKYVAYKGSITLDGVSLTIAEKTKNGCKVALVPYTLTNTTFGEKKVGDVLNIETDILAKYTEELLVKN